MRVVDSDLMLVVKKKAEAEGVTVEAYIEALVRADDCPVSDEAQAFVDAGQARELEYGDGPGVDFLAGHRVNLSPQIEALISARAWTKLTLPKDYVRGLIKNSIGASE